MSTRKLSPGVLSILLLPLACIVWPVEGRPAERETNFKRGDATGEGEIDLGDALFILRFLYQSGPAPSCADAADANDDGQVAMADGLQLLNYLFLGGVQPAVPFTACGPDGTADALDCIEQEGCPQPPTRRALHETPILRAGPGDEPPAGEEPLAVDGSPEHPAARLSSKESRALPRPRIHGGGGSDGQPVALGQLVSGEITSHSQVDAFTFSATAGQWIVADRLASSNSAGLSWRIEDSWGRVVAGDPVAFRDLGPVQLLGGSYTLSVLPEGSGKGTYEFRIVEAAPEERAVSAGDTVNGEIDPEHPGQRDIYIVSSPASQSLYLDLLSPGNSNLRWQLEDSLGRVLIPSRELANFGPTALLGGEYRLSVEGPLSGNDLLVAPYSFRLVGLAAPEPRPIALGETVTGALSQPGEIDLFSLSIPPGQLIFLDQIASSSVGALNWELLDRLGRAVLARTGNLADVAPPPLMGGDYLLRILGEGDITASYEFRVADANPAAASVAIGSEVADAIPADRPGQVRTYEFTADPGRRVTVELLETSNLGGLNWRLDDAYGLAALPRTNSLLTAGPVTLAGGLHRVSVLGEGSQTGSYRFRIRDDGLEAYTPAGDPALIGSEVAGAIPAPGGSASYLFTAAPVQRVFLDLVEGHADLDWSLINPVGRRIELKRANSPDLLSDLGPYPLAGGVYTILLQARTATAAPPFRFRIADAPVIERDAIVGNTLAGDFAGAAGSVHRYRFAVLEGQRIFLDRLNPTNRLDWRLVDPAGAAVFALASADDANSDRGPFPLASGTYSLELDPQAGFEPTYELRILAVEETEVPVALGQVIAGSFAGQAGSTRSFLVEAEAGNRLYFDRITLSSRLNWSLIDPAGQPVFGPAEADAASSDQGPFALAPGSYRLVVDPFAGFEPAYDFRIYRCRECRHAAFLRRPPEWPSSAGRHGGVHVRSRRRPTLLLRPTRRRRGTTLVALRRAWRSGLPR